MVAPAPHPVHALAELVADADAMQRVMDADPESLKQIEQVLADHQIELFERPSKQPGVSGNPGASPKQLDLQRAILDATHRIYAAVGANRSGKTECVGGMGFCKLIRDQARDGDVCWVIAQRQEDLRNVPAKTLWKFLPRSMFPKDIEYSPRMGFGQIPTLHLTLPDGRGKCEIWFRSEEMALNVFESAKCRFVWWTECTRESIFDALSTRLADAAGLLLMDYVSYEPWLADRVHNSGHPKVYAQRFGMADNAHNLPPGEIEYQRSILPADVARVKIDGEDGGFEGVVFKEFSSQPHEDGGNVVQPFSPAEDWPVWCYIDVGKYTAAVLYTCPDGGGRVACDEVYTLGENVEANASAIKSMLERHNVDIGRVTFKMDPAAWAYTAANNATVGDQYANEGILCSPWTRTQVVGESAMLDRARIDCQHRIFRVSSACENLIREMQTWRHKTDRDGKVDPREAYTGANHAIDTAKAWLWERPTFEQADLEIIDTAAF